MLSQRTLSSSLTHQAIYGQVAEKRNIKRCGMAYLRIEQYAGAIEKTIRLNMLLVGLQLMDFVFLFRNLIQSFGKKTTHIGGQSKRYRRGLDDRKFVGQDLFLNMDIHSQVRNGTSFEGRASVLWKGGDGDTQMDILLIHQVTYSCWNVILLLSIKATGGMLIREAVRCSTRSCQDSK